MILKSFGEAPGTDVGDAIAAQVELDEGARRCFVVLFDARLLEDQRVG